MKITMLKDHILLNTVAETCRGYIKKCDPVNPNKDPSPSRKERYALNVLMSISSVAICIDQLYYSIEFLSGYSSIRTHKKMNRYDYIVFGIENYYLRLTSVYDRCLRLTNDIFQLGLPEKECRESTIIQNQYIKGTAVAKSLKAIDNFTKPFRYYRNMVAHESTYSEQKLDKLASYYLVTEDDDELKKYFHLYKSETDKYVANKKLDFKKNVEKLEALVKVLFDDLYDFHMARLGSFTKEVYLRQ